MNQSEIEHLILSLPDVTSTNHFGYRFFFYASETILPFVTIAETDNEHDQVSNLHRDGVFRINIGVSKETYRLLFQEAHTAWDYTGLNRFMPHPHYAAQHFICVLNPIGEVAIQTCEYIRQAHALAQLRIERKQQQND